MFVCTECEQEFETPKKYVETHGLPCPPYEEFYGCPFCGGIYEEAMEEEEDTE